MQKKSKDSKLKTRFQCLIKRRKSTFKAILTSFNGRRDKHRLKANSKTLTLMQNKKQMKWIWRGQGRRIRWTLKEWEYAILISHKIGFTQCHHSLEHLLLILTSTLTRFQTFLLSYSNRCILQKPLINQFFSSSYASNVYC